MENTNHYRNCLHCSHIIIAYIYCPGQASGVEVMRQEIKGAMKAEKQRRCDHHGSRSILCCRSVRKPDRYRDRDRETERQSLHRPSFCLTAMTLTGAVR